MQKKIEVDLELATTKKEIIDIFYTTLVIEESMRNNWDAFYDNFRDITKLSKLEKINEMDEIQINVFGCKNLSEQDLKILKDLLISATDDTQRNDSTKLFVRVSR